MTETIIPIPNFSRYKASSNGYIISNYTGNPRKPCLCRDGYERLCMRRDDGKDVTMYVHRLILLTFHGEQPDGMEACHNDGDRRNNRADNRRWDTHSNNNRDIHKHGNGNIDGLWYGNKANGLRHKDMR